MILLEKKYLLLFCILVTIIILCNNPQATYAKVWKGSNNGTSGKWREYCYNYDDYDTCAHWGYMSYSQFETLKTNGYIYVAENGADEALEKCNKNEPIIASYIPNVQERNASGEYRKSGHGGIANVLSPMDLSKYRLENLDSTTGLYGSYNVEKGQREDIRNLYVDANNTKTVQDLLTNEVKNDKEVAFFCNAMFEPAVTSTTVTYSVIEKATINGTEYTDGTYPISGDADGKATVTINFSREVKSNPAGYANWHDESMLITEDGVTTETNYGGIGDQTLTNKSITVTLDQVNSKKVCATSTIAPQTETWSGGSQISNSGTDDDDACVTIKMNWTSETSVETESLEQQDVIYTASCNKNPASTEIELPVETQDQTIEYTESTGQWESGSLPTGMTGVSLPDASHFGHSYSQTISLQPGQDETAKYDGFHEKIYTVKYKKIDHYTETTVHNADGSESTSKVLDYTTYEHLGTDVRDGDPITCNDTHIYRMTEINTSTEINLKSVWNVNSTSHNLGSDGITHTVDDTNPIGTKIYSPSKNGEAINLNYTYSLNYEWLTGTYSARLANFNTINWWAYRRTTQLQEYSLYANSSSGTKSENNPDQTITNAAGNPVNNDESDTITLGSIQEYCRSAKAPATYEAGYQTNPTQKGTSLNTATICAKIYRPWNYNLNFTSIENTSSGGKLYANNEKITVTANLENNNNIYSDPNQEGNPSYSPETTFTLHQVTIPDSTSITDVSSYIQQLKESIDAGTPLLDTKEIQGVLQQETFGPESSNNEIKFDNVSFEQAGVGNHVCLFIVANRTNSNKDTTGNTNTYYGETHPHNLYSDLTCFTIAGFPTFQVRGGSILTNGNAKAKVVTSDGEAFGSWIDYGLITNGEIKELSSGKAFIGSESEYKYPNNHPLTIANNEAHTPGSNDPKGKSGINPNATKDHLLAIYGSNAHIAPLTSTMIDISNNINYTTFTSNQFTTISTNPNSKYRYTKINNTSDAIITQTSQLNSGITHVIYATGNIIIGSNLTYTNASNLSQITDIPQYIIISEKSIYIDKDVSEIHAWLIANDEINTCTGYTGWQNPTGTDNILHKQDGGGGGGYNSTTYNKDVCNKALAVYGPIFAKNIWLERTSIGGSGSTSGVSELINLTAENYYWALAKAKESNKISTAYTRSLAPRY